MILLGDRQWFHLINSVFPIPFSLTYVPLKTRLTCRTHPHLNESYSPISFLQQSLRLSLTGNVTDSFTKRPKTTETTYFQNIGNIIFFPPHFKYWSILNYTVVLVSGVQQRDSGVYVCILFKFLFCYSSLLDTEYCSLCHAVGLCCLPVLYI